MPKKGKKASSQSALGRALMHARFAPPTTSSQRHTTTTTAILSGQSVTQESDLDSFLHTAELAATDFTAEKLNVTVLNPALSSHLTNPYLLTAEQESEKVALYKEYESQLCIPKRPAWTPSTTPEELHLAERTAFLDWRRHLAHLEEDQGLLMTPFEKNLEIWKQLWRVVERCDLLVQIVDARNPGLFRCPDLEAYVSESGDGKKKNLLLLNKADLLTVEQRTAWADYFVANNIPYRFFSASLSKERQEAEKERLAALEESLQADLLVVSDGEEEEETSSYVMVSDPGATAVPAAPSDSEGSGEEEQEEVELQEPTPTEYFSPLDVAEEENVPARVRIWDAVELIELFKSECPVSLRETAPGETPSSKVSIGFVGYPNVGKSSTLNALMGAHKVAVGATPGKTKHFQTFHLDESMILCDCPGLVFPSFATTKADMVCNGILPIDQMREYLGPSGLVAQRIPREIVEAVYGIQIRLFANDVESLVLSKEKKTDERAPTAEELLIAFALARGFTKASQGNPDESRAARHILKDYVQGKLLFVHPPPGVDAKEFNAALYKSERYIAKKKKEAELAMKEELALASGHKKKTPGAPPPGTSNMDLEFFEETEAVKARTVGKFVRKDFVRGSGVSNAPVDLNGVEATLPSKKSHKTGKKAVKSRTQWTAVSH